MNFEAETEAIAFTPEQEADLLAMARERAHEQLAKLVEATDQDELFTALPKAALAAFRLADFGRATQLANQALELAPLYTSEWNYGNAIHFAHTTLGLVALESGDIAAAIAHLRQSGDTKGSPQLNSFGPSMQLARGLLQVNEISPVLHYFNQCRGFWHSGGAWLDVYEAKVKAGAVPNFFWSLYR